MTGETDLLALTEFRAQSDPKVSQGSQEFEANQDCRDRQELLGLEAFKSKPDCKTQPGRSMILTLSSVQNCLLRREHKYHPDRLEREEMTSRPDRKLF